MSTSHVNHPIPVRLCSASASYALAEGLGHTIGVLTVLRLSLVLSQFSTSSTAKRPGYYGHNQLNLLLLLPRNTAVGDLHMLLPGREG